MAKPLDNAAFKGGNRSLTLFGKTFPVGPQTTTFKRPDGSSGAIALVTPGLVFDGYDCRGRDLLIQADNVTVRNCLFNAVAYHTLNNQDGHRGLVVEICMFDGEKANNANGEAVYSEAADTIVRQSIFLNLPSDAVNMAGGQMTRNAFSGACYATGAHADAISVHKTLGPMLISENYIDFMKRPDSTQGPNSCAKIVSHFGPINDVLIDRNVLIGGGFNAYVGDGGKGVPSNVRMTNNLMGLTEYGDTANQFVAGGDHGAGFVNTGNTLFSATADSVVAIGGSSGQPTPAPAPVPTPTPAPIPPTVNPVCIVKPTIEGGRTVGERAVTASGTWKDAKPDWSFVWAWTLDGKLIDGAKSWDYTPTAPGQLVVAVAVTTPAGGKTIVTSDPVTVAPVVAPTPTPVPPPVPTPAPTPTPTPAPVVDAALRKAVTDAAATLENLAYSLRQLAK